MTTVDATPAPKTSSDEKEVRADVETERQAAAELAEAVATVRSELPRVDAKAGALFGGLGVVLAVAGLSTGAAGGLSGELSAAAAVLGWGVVVSLGLAVVLLAVAMRPRIRPGAGRYGALAYTAGTPEQLAERARRLVTRPDVEAQAAELAGLSRSLRFKFAVVRCAIDLAVGGSALSAAAAAVVYLAG